MTVSRTKDGVPGRTGGPFDMAGIQTSGSVVCGFNEDRDSVHLRTSTGGGIVGSGEIGNLWPEDSVVVHGGWYGDSSGTPSSDDWRTSPT